MLKRLVTKLNTYFVANNVKTAKEFPKNLLKVESMEGTNSRHPDLVPGPKRKAAILMAYCGENFYGLQMDRNNRSLRTIEREFFQALVKAKVVPSNCWDDPKKMSYRCASRTDKGVSTCGQVVSLKMIMNENVAELINKELPKDIRILAVRRTTQGFNSQIYADGRTYIYTLPTFAFSDFAKENENYRITQDKLDKIKFILYRLKGTHTFHNFTSGKKMGDDSAKRYIIEFNFEKQFIHENMEFMTFRIKGQSFMIHQIRKMMGLVIAMVSGYANEEYYVRAFSSPLEDIPKAPGTGLVLEQVHYDKYNKNYSKQHGGLDFAEAADDRKKFMMERIMPYIYKQEIENNCMREWLDNLSVHDYSGETSKLQWKEQCEREKNKKLQNLEENSQSDNGENIETKSVATVENNLTEDNKREELKSENEEKSDEPTLKKIKL